MKPIHLAKILIRLGPFMTEEVTQIPDRSAKTLDAIKNRFKTELVLVVFFDVFEMEHAGLQFRSEPVNKETVFEVAEEELNQQIEEEKKEIVAAISQIIQPAHGKKTLH